MNPAGNHIRTVLPIAPVAVCVTLIAPVAAMAQQGPSDPLTQNLANPTLDFFRPPPNLFQIMYETRTAPGSGSTPGAIREVSTDTVNLRYDHAFDLPGGWILATRFDLPLLAKNPLSTTNPDGDFLYGIGDVNTQAALIHDINARWAFGFGLRLTAPTGDDALGSGKWQLMPIVGARLALPELSQSSYFEPLLRYAVSVAGDPTRRDISNLQLAPMLNVGLPDRWSVSFYPSPDIRYNFGDPVTGQTGHWFVPFDVRVGKKFSDNVALSFEVGVPIIKDYPVYNLKTETRLNITW